MRVRRSGKEHAMSVIIFGIIVLPILIFVMRVWGGYRTAYHLEQDAKRLLSNVWSLYKRRLDLIGNLVKTVQGSADFEKSTLDAVISARARASQVMLTPDQLNDTASLKALHDVQSEVGSALSRLLVTIEQYPTLRSTDAFRDLQMQLEKTENELHQGRADWNRSVARYNSIRNGSITAPLGCTVFAPIILRRELPLEMTSFEQVAGSEDAPKIEFSFGGVTAPTQQ